jgi:hypothetical protein
MFFLGFVMKTLTTPTVKSVALTALRLSSTINLLLAQQKVFMRQVPLRTRAALHTKPDVVPEAFRGYLESRVSSMHIKGLSNEAIVDRPLKPRELGFLLRASYAYAHKKNNLISTR